MLYVKKSGLANAVSVLGRIVNEKARVEAWKGIRFSVKGGNLSLSASDGECWMTTRVKDAKTEGDFEAIVPYSELKDLVKGGKSGEIGFDFGKESVKVSEEINGQVISREIKLLKAENYPEFPVVDEHAKEITLPVGFVNQMNTAAQILNKHEVRRILQGINLNKDGIIATNGRELIHIELPLDLDEDVTFLMPHLSLLIPDDSKHTLKVWTDNTLKKKYVAFESEKGIYICQALQGIYPNWKQVIPSSSALDVSMRLDQKSMTSLLEFLKRVPKHEPHNEIKLSAEGNQLAVSVQYASDMKLSLSIEFRGKTFNGHLSMSKDYLQRLLMLGHDTLDLSSGTHMPMVASGGIGRYIFMPILVNSTDVKKEEKIEFKTNALKTENNEKENVKMEENKKNEAINAVTTIPAEQNPLDDLNKTIDDFRIRLKAMFDESSVISRKIKEAVIFQKQKERDFVMAKRAIEKIKMVSGF